MYTTNIMNLNIFDKTYTPNIDCHSMDWKKIDNWKQFFNQYVCFQKNFTTINSCKIEIELQYYLALYIILLL